MAKPKVICLETKDQAQAMADFLWNEIQRHTEDIERCQFDLANIKNHWDVNPHQERIFVETTKA